SAYSIRLQRRDPGPDDVVNTADDGGMFAIYDYTAAYAGAAFVGNMRVNVPNDRDDRLQRIELALNKRSSQRWTASVSTNFTKNNRWQDAIVTNPNQEYFQLDSTWEWT